MHEKEFVDQPPMEVYATLDEIQRLVLFPGRDLR